MACTLISVLYQYWDIEMSLLQGLSAATLAFIDEQERGSR